MNPLMLLVPVFIERRLFVRRHRPAVEAALDDLLRTVWRQEVTRERLVQDDFAVDDGRRDCRTIVLMPSTKAYYRIRIDRRDRACCLEASLPRGRIEFPPWVWIGDDWLMNRVDALVQMLGQLPDAPSVIGMLGTE